MPFMLLLWEECLVTDEPMTLIDRLQNPAWCHSNTPFESPQLETLQTVGDMREAADEIERLRKGIQDYLDGNYVNPRSFRGDGGKCAHGIWWYSECVTCDGDHFATLLTPAERPDVEKTGEGQS